MPREQELSPNYLVQPSHCLCFRRRVAYDCEKNTHQSQRYGVGVADGDHSLLQHAQIP